MIHVTFAGLLDCGIRRRRRLEAAGTWSALTTGFCLRSVKTALKKTRRNQRLGNDDGMSSAREVVKLPRRNSSRHHCPRLSIIKLKNLKTERVSSEWETEWRKAMVECVFRCIEGLLAMGLDGKTDMLDCWRVSGD